MTATTTIYRVAAQNEMIRHYHFATKKEAKAFAREWRRDNPDKDFDDPEIDPVVVELNARDIAKALDDFISMTCANEG